MTDQPKEKEPSQTMIYVSNLPFTTTDEQLRELFKGHDIKTAYIAKRRNGRSKGFGFVNLVKESEQNAAISKVDGKEIDGRKITAKIAFNDPRRNDQGELKEEFKTNLPKQGATSDTVVYVANIPWTFKDEELKGVFSGLDVKLATVATRRNGRSKGFGFVEFGSKEACIEALKKDQLKVLSSDPTPQERIITVRASHNYRGNQPRENDNQQRGNNNRGGDNNRGGRRQRDSNNRGRSRDNNRRPTGNSNQGDRNPPRKLENTLYVSNIPFDLDDNDLKQIFSEFHVKSSHVATRQNGKSRGFGFVEFNNAKDQTEALNALNQSEVNNRVITVRVATGQRTTRDNNNRGGSDRGNRNRSNNNRGGSRGGNRGGDNNRGGNDNRGGNNRRNENRNTTHQQPREPSSTMV
jgi:RNA recognition motif-containing protein